MFFLVDCDNFFVSCERVFQPYLKNHPVVVLSNNDGCVVSRSYEAKALGIPMACPYFKIEHLFTSNNGIALSSNYELYADMSRRIMNWLQSNFNEVEIYSIDEAFVKFEEDKNPEEIALFIRNNILQQTGISVSVGIARTKTLCKIASHFAKKKNNHKIHFFDCEASIDTGLKNTEVLDIWGVGRNIAPKLNFLGIFTAFELKNAPIKMIRQSLGINLEKTVQELNNFPCIDIETVKASQTIITSRSFEFEINNYETIAQIIAEFVDTACLRLREKEACANGISVYIHTNRFNLSKAQYNNQVNIMLENPSNSTSNFIKAAQQGLLQIYDANYSYKKAGIMLIGIEALNNPQNDLFSNKEISQKEISLMQAFDSINKKLGKKSIYFGAQANGVKYYIKREFKSRNFTTSWQDLLEVK